MSLVCTSTNLISEVIISVNRAGVRRGPRFQHRHNPVYEQAPEPKSRQMTNSVSWLPSSSLTGEKASNNDDF